MIKRHIQHLHWRVGFGIIPKNLEILSRKEKTQVIDELFIDSTQISPLNVDTSDIDYIPNKAFLKDPINRDKFLKKSIQKTKELNYAWIERLTNPHELLREKMTLFWANHFVCKDNNIFHVQQFNNTLREYALGDFRDFVKAISKEAAMIKYLNNNQNRKQKPNENFARELMELFTLGVSNYTEEDVKESARAFTGYNFMFEGDFYIKSKDHDYDFKSFFGLRGRYDGDDIIDIILDQKQCAQFISEKIYNYFVNDVINSNHINEMVNVFYPNYNIEELMRFVFSSDWFYDEENIGAIIKSPIELLVGIQNIVPLLFKEPVDILKIQKLLNQILLNPPNVDGWKGDKNWIDSNTIMMRLKLPSILLNDSYISLKQKGDTNTTYLNQNVRHRKYNKIFNVEPNWNTFNKNFGNSTYKEIQETLILCSLNKGTELFLDNLNQMSKKEFCVQLMSLPEYQLC